MRNDIVILSICLIFGGSLLYLLIAQSWNKDVARDAGKRWASVLLAFILLLSGTKNIGGVASLALILVGVLPSNKKWGNQLAIVACIPPVIFALSPLARVFSQGWDPLMAYPLFMVAINLVFFAYLLRWRLQSLRNTQQSVPADASAASPLQRR